jgi:hypothetical protein
MSESEHGPQDDSEPDGWADQIGTSNGHDAADTESETERSREAEDGLPQAPDATEDREPVVEEDPVSDGADVDWPALFAEVNAAGEELSRTQMQLAVAVSEETGGAGEGDALRLAEEAVEAGRLAPVKRKTSGEGPEAMIKTFGYQVAEASDD